MTFRTFGGIPTEFGQRESSRISLLSIPYDGTSTWGKGADQGFEAMLDAADNMELYDIETDSEVYRQGIWMPQALSDFSSPESMYQSVYRSTQQMLTASDQFPTFFGGEHSISIGIIKAFYEKYPDLTVVQFDAHTDLRPSYEGTAYNHACAMYDASQNCNLIQIGIRSMDVSEKEYVNAEQCFMAHELTNRSDWMERALSFVHGPVYLTIDLDVFDSSIMPSTGTPEPGGLNWDQVTRFCKQLFATADVVGMDIVELAPIDGMKAPNYLAAKLYYKLLSYKFHGHGF